MNQPRLSAPGIGVDYGPKAKVELGQHAAWFSAKEYYPDGVLGPAGTLEHLFRARD